MTNQTNNTAYQSHGVLSGLFDEPTEKRLDVMEPQNAKGSTLETLESMSVPRILKMKNPPVPLLDLDGEPLTGEDGEAITVDTGLYSLIRDNSWEKDNRPRFFETVSESYEQVGAWEVAEMLDNLDGFKPDSVAFRNEGETMLVSMKLDELDVWQEVRNSETVQKRREAWNYNPSEDEDRNGGVDIRFFLSNPMGGSGTIKGGLKATVKVCANGMVIPMGIETFSITHYEGAKMLLEDWLEHLWKATTGKGLVAYKQALNHLATIPIELPKVHWIADSIYMPETIIAEDAYNSSPKRGRIPFEVYYNRMSKHNLKQEQKANTVVQLVTGMGRGVDGSTPITGWDVMMGVSEFENYKRTRRGYDTSPVKIFEGERKANMHTAYNMIIDVNAVIPEDYLNLELAPVPVSVNA